MGDEPTPKWKKWAKWMMVGGGCVTMLATPFYTTVVMQNLWNWFVSVHTAEISYWQSFGIMLAITLATYRDDDTERDEKRWTRLFSLLDHVIPPEALSDLKASFVKDDGSLSTTLEMFLPKLNKVAVNTILLVVGFGVHTFLI